MQQIKQLHTTYLMSLDIPLLKDIQQMHGQ
jgi:hypothetical protein